MSDVTDGYMEDLLAEHADKLVAGEANATLWRVAGPELRELMALAGRVSRVLTPVEPSPRFVSRLRRNLLGQGERRVFPQVRLQMPTLRFEGKFLARVRDALVKPYLAGAIGVALLALVLVRLRSLQSDLARVRLPKGEHRSAVTA